MKIIRTLLFSLLALLVLSGCQSKRTPALGIVVDKIIERNYEVIDTTAFMEFPIGINMEENELYVKDSLKESKTFVIKIIDLTSSKIQREVQLKAGDFNSPIEYFSPSHIQLIDNRYYVVDQFEETGGRCAVSV